MTVKPSNFHEKFEFQKGKLRVFRPELAALGRIPALARGQAAVASPSNEIDEIITLLSANNLEIVAQQSVPIRVSRKLGQVSTP